jgi:regulator of nucleoside diphosphate kinase
MMLTALFQLLLHAGRLQAGE